MRFEPILPKRRDVISADKAVQAGVRALTAVANDIWRVCSTYEVPSSLIVQPYVRRVRNSKTGNLNKRHGSRRIGYVRTNTLKRSWSKSQPMQIGGDIVIEVRSSGKIAPYNVFVRGPKSGPKDKRQSAAMAARGWMSIDDIAAKEWGHGKRYVAQAFMQAAKD